MASGFFAEVLDISPPSGSREAIDTSHMLSVGAREFCPGTLIDWGEMSVDMILDPGVRPPIDDAEETVTITFPDGETWEFTGFMTGYDPSVPLEDRMTATATVKVSGDVTITDVS
jgi:hypothetical protein